MQTIILFPEIYRTEDTKGERRRLVLFNVKSSSSSSAMMALVYDVDEVSRDLVVIRDFQQNGGSKWRSKESGKAVLTLEKCHDFVAA